MSFTKVSRSGLWNPRKKGRKPKKKIKFKISSEEDNRLFSNGDYGEDDVENENDNGTAEPAQEDEGEKSLPLRLPGVSLSGRRTARFVLR